MLEKWTQAETELFGFALEILADRMRHEPDEYTDEEFTALGALQRRYIDQLRDAS